MPVVWGNEADLALGGFGMLEEVMAVPAAEVREGAPEVVAEIGLHGAGGLSVLGRLMALYEREGIDKACNKPTGRTGRKVLGDAQHHVVVLRVFKYFHAFALLENV